MYSGGNDACVSKTLFLCEPMIIIDRPIHQLRKEDHSIELPHYYRSTPYIGAPREPAHQAMRKTHRKRVLVSRETVADQYLLRTKFFEAWHGEIGAPTLPTMANQEIALVASDEILILPLFTLVGRT